VRLKLASPSIPISIAKSISFNEIDKTVNILYFFNLPYFSNLLKNLPVQSTFYGFLAIINLIPIYCIIRRLSLEVLESRR
jgi:hypothetical protein